MPLAPTPPPESIAVLSLSDLHALCQNLKVPPTTLKPTTWVTFRKALIDAKIPLTTKVATERNPQAARIIHWVEVKDDEDFAFLVNYGASGDTVVNFLYMGSRLLRNPIASFKLVVESRMKLMRDLGCLEHDADPEEEARINALAASIVAGESNS